MATEPVATPIKSKNTGTVPILPSRLTQMKLVKYANNCMDFLNNNFNLREVFRQRDLDYYREKGKDTSGQRAAASNAAGDSSKIRGVTIPVVMPQVETALTFLSDIFLNSYPIFPVVSKPNMSDPALQMETLIGEHSIKYAWQSNLMLTFRDGLKYNLMAVEVCWKTNRIWTVEEDNTIVGGRGKGVETYYEGNYIKRLSPYNLILDTRVQNPSRMHIDGEFIGYTDLANRVQLKQLIQDLGSSGTTMNAKEAFESGTASYTTNAGTANYYIPEVNPYNFDKTNAGLTTTNWLAWAGLESKDGIKYHDMYEITYLYCRIIPADYDLNVSSKNNIQIWKLILVNRKVVIYCERQTNAHNFLPIIIGQPTEDGLGFQTKSFGENAVPMQDAATALYNSAIESQRRKVYDRIFYDPSKINKRDIDNTSSVARIPVKQTAYGMPIEQSVYAMPYRDEGVSTVLQMSSDMVSQADRVNGQNRAQQGQFQKGNKSRREFETVMGNANGRMQTMALMLEFQFFQPIKEIIKLNILQFQPPTTLFNRNTNQPVQIKPQDIRAAALEFKLSDGVLPADKLINTDALQEVLQMTAGNPALLAEYDVVGMIMYSLQLQGASWIQDFKRAPAQQTAVMQNQQAVSGVTNAAGQPIAPVPTTAPAPQSVQ